MLRRKRLRIIGALAAIERCAGGTASVQEGHPAHFEVPGGGIWKTTGRGTS
jgi:hypothetical protein